MVIIMENQFITKTSSIRVKLPLFIPVYRPDFDFELFTDDSLSYSLNAVMVNSFLLFRDEELRSKFRQGYTLREYIGGFPGMICTDSGAFQQLGGRKVRLDPVEIVRFQNFIKTDIAAPLDLITPPDTDYNETYRRMVISQYRIEEGLSNSEYSDLVGLQQGGGFFSLRQKHIRQLADMGVIRYYGIGSMVPFFNKNHDLLFTCNVIKDARSVIGENVPMHVYGAGDPLDIAFMFHAGANVFDSSSYAHYAAGGYYMTPYGAVNKRNACEKLGFNCNCPVCSKNNLSDIFDVKNGIRLREQHNLFLLLLTMKELQVHNERKELEKYLSRIYEKHIENSDLFPNSKLSESWEGFLRNDIVEYAGDVQRKKFSKYILRSDFLVEAHSDLTHSEIDLLEEIASEVSKTYKMDIESIMKILAKELKSPRWMNFRFRIASCSTRKDIQRLKDYKLFVKNARKSIYNILRQYKSSEDKLNDSKVRLIECHEDELETCVTDMLIKHISTKERLASRDEFIIQLGGLVYDGDVLIDIGCGINPLLLPVDFYRRLSRYIAVDKDSESVEIVRIFSKRYGIENLFAYTWDIGDGIDELNALTGCDSYDIALLLKVIPVVNRADQKFNTGKECIPVLGNFPAKRVLATVSKESMTKHKSIEKRETGVLKHFVDDYHYNIESEFSCGCELGYYLSSRN